MNYFHSIRKRLKTLGVKSQVARVIALDFDKQVRSRGLVSALSYFKDTGETLIGFISGSKYKAPWVATKNGYPRKWLLLKDTPIEVQLRVAKMARKIFLSYPTPETVTKLKEAAMSDFSGTVEALDALSSYQRSGLEHWNPRIPAYKGEFGTVLRASRSFVSKSVPEGPPLGFDLRKVAATYFAWSGLIHKIPGWQDAIYPVHTSWLHSPKCDFTDLDGHCGLIGGKMEPGGKLRLFAAPSVLLQELLTPLQVWLDSIRIQLDVDSFKDQEAGALWAQRKMRAGVQVQSIDLSSATCRWPFSTQVELLEDLGCPTPVLDLYKAVARGKWKVEPKWRPYFGDTINWTVGQPLGVNPSMSSFALSHELVLTGIALSLGLDPEDSFRVLGDDVLCADENLAKTYRNLVTQCGIKISEHKSFASNRYGEFAGYSITPDTMVRPGKWWEVSEWNVQNLIKELGGQVLFEIDNLDHRDLEAIIAFRAGTFDPPLVDYPYYLFMSSVLWEPNTFQVSLKQRESDWYMGCTKHLRGLYPSIFFQPPTEHSLYTRLVNRLRLYLPSIKTELGYCLGPVDPDTWLPHRLVACCEALLAIRCRDVSELEAAMKVVSAEYEAYLWQLPRSDTSRRKSERKRLRNRLATLQIS